MENIEVLLSEVTNRLAKVDWSDQSIGFFKTISILRSGLNTAYQQGYSYGLTDGIQSIGGDTKPTHNKEDD